MTEILCMTNHGVGSPQNPHFVLVNVAETNGFSSRLLAPRLCVCGQREFVEFEVHASHLPH